MTKRQQNNCFGTGYPTETGTVISGLWVILGTYCGLLKDYLDHNTCSIVWHKGYSSTNYETSMPIITMSTLKGVNFLDFTVQIMAKIIETLRLTRLVMFLAATAFLKSSPKNIETYYGGVSS